MTPENRMWLLLFIPWLLLLPACSGCVFCSQPQKNLRERFNTLCEEYQRATNTSSCTEYPAPHNFNPFGLDDQDLFTITEKTHRVFRVLEISRDQLRIAAYWDWLHEVKLVEYTHSVLCPPFCEDSMIIYNCTTCRLRHVRCLSEIICYPTIPALYQGMWIILCSSAFFFSLGVIAFTAEYWRDVMRAEGQNEKTE